MKGTRGLRLGLAGATAIAAVLLGGMILTGVALAASGTISISSGSAMVGEEDEVTLTAMDVSDPGLGAWTIDIQYDNSVIDAVDCTPEQGGVCNPNFADDTVRITGASASGLEGDSTLGVIEFECGDDPGESELEISIFTFADATLGGPEPIDATVVDGSFDCDAEVVAPPDAGTGFVSEATSNGWLIAVLAYLGLATIAVGAIRQRAR